MTNGISSQARGAIAVFSSVMGATIAGSCAAWCCISETFASFGAVTGLIAGSVSAPLAYFCLRRKDVFHAFVVTWGPVFILESYCNHLQLLFVVMFGPLFAYWACLLLAYMFLPESNAPTLPGMCTHCGYDLRGCTGDRCSECGTVQEMPWQRLPASTRQTAAGGSTDGPAEQWR